MYSVTLAPSLVTPKGLERICAIGPRLLKLFSEMQKRADCPLLHLVCIYDYITVLWFCVGFILELPSNFYRDFLLESSKLPTMSLLISRLPKKNDFEYPPLTLWIFSAEKLFLFRVCRALRSAPNAIFTSGVVKGNGRCSASFCESAALRACPLPLGGAVAQRLRGF